MPAVLALKTRFHFIHFTEDEDGNWQCRNNREPEPPMATIGWYPAWKKWVFAQNEPQCVFSSDCLRDIARFIDSLPKPKDPEEPELPF